MNFVAKIFPRRRCSAVGKNAQLVVGHWLSHAYWRRRWWSWWNRWWRSSGVDVCWGRRVVGHSDRSSGHFRIAWWIVYWNDSSTVTEFCSHDCFTRCLFGSTENFLRVASRLRNDAENFESRRHFPRFLPTAFRCKPWKCFCCSEFFNCEIFVRIATVKTS